jgi:hypothetical protein
MVAPLRQEIVMEAKIVMVTLLLIVVTWLLFKLTERLEPRK